MNGFMFIFVLISSVLSQSDEPYRGRFSKYPNLQPPRLQAQSLSRLPEPFIPIRSQTSDISPDGAYDFSYETANGIFASETGTPKDTPEGVIEVVRGYYSYTAPDGTPIAVEYYADETGFHANTISSPFPAARGQYDTVNNGQRYNPSILTKRNSQYL